MKKFVSPAVLLGCLLVVPFESALPQTDDAIVGVNLGHAQTETVEQQTTLVNDLKAAGVHVIRTGIGPDDKGLDLVNRIYAQGIKILWIIPLKYRPDAPMRPWRPKEFPGMWAGPPLSSADPDRFRTYFQALLDKLESMGITLSGFELGNELNMAAFNPEFPLPGQGKQFGLDALHHDPEAQQIAKGYLQYLKVLSVLKDIRDHSRLNQHTPILTAGFGAYEAPEGSFGKGPSPDMVSVNATLDFMRANGLDKLVDAYAVHVYPWANAPGDPAAAAGRRSRLAKYVLAECRSAGSSDGKPCWVTEWGFKNNDTSCPVHEADQVTLIEEMRNGFSQYAEQGSLAGLLYYAWIDTAENFGVFRCGALTQSGRLAVAPIDPNRQFCKACLRIRVGLPRVVRGPAADIADNRFTEFQLPDGRFRGFDAHGETRAIDGDHPWDMGGGARVVLSRGKPGAYDSCGQWIQHVELAGKTLLGFVHDETACRYQAGQTHKSMSFAVSTDYGLTWKDQGQIITGRDSPTASKNTGEGDCTFLNGQDGYYYGYCGRPRDGAVIVARALVSRLGPGNWMKFFQGQWDQPGLGGDDTSLGKGLGTSAARWTSNGETVLLGWVRAGMGLFFSSDHTTFTPLPEPMLDLDPGIWRRPDPSEVYAYPVMLDAKTGGNQLSNSWMLVYAYWPPYEGADQKYLVFRSVDVSIASTPVTPQVGVLLARWYSPQLHDHWSTTAPVPGNYSRYSLEAKSGYLMTVADPAEPCVQLEDCVSQWPGHPDHMLDQNGVCEADRFHFQRLRTAGWVYSTPQPGTQPLYRCYSDSERSHFAANSADCDHLGKMEKLLGYDLKE